MRDCPSASKSSAGHLKTNWSSPSRKPSSRPAVPGYRPLLMLRERRCHHQQRHRRKHFPASVCCTPHSGAAVRPLGKCSETIGGAFSKRRLLFFPESLFPFPPEGVKCGPLIDAHSSAHPSQQLLQPPPSQPG